MEDNFSKFHPAVKLFYFVSVIMFSMFFMHPVFISISLVSALTYSIVLKWYKEIIKFVLSLLPVLLIMIIINMFFNSEGSDIILCFWGANITLQSLVYSICSSAVFINVIMWFLCFNKIVSFENILFLFSKYIPKVSLMFSICFSSVNKFVYQAKQIRKTQKYLGLDIADGGLKNKIINSFRIIIILVMWALEGSLDMLNSMKSRGYGLPERTTFRKYKFNGHDLFAILIIVSLDILVFVGCVFKENIITFYPVIVVRDVTNFSVLIYISYLLLCLFPVIFNILEDVKWLILRLKT